MTPRRKRPGELRRRPAAKLRGLAAINRVRRGEAKSLTQAALAEGTTVKSIKKLLPAAIIQDRSGRAIRVKAGDPYSAPVEITTNLGVIVVSARGSRERKLAGRHHAVIIKVLKGELPGSALQDFLDKKVGGQILLSNSDRLFELLKGGELSQLDAVYVGPETRG
jgi:hypothetical protein